MPVASTSPAPPKANATTSTVPRSTPRVPTPSRPWTTSAAGSDMTLAVGFIGLGAMGRGMARNLHRAGLLRGVWNRTRDRASELAEELGCGAASRPAELAADCDVLVLCVSADADVLQVVDDVAPALHPGSIVIDCSTVAADTAREAARRLAGRSIEFLDAPVSGGVEGASKGTL